MDNFEVFITKQMEECNLKLDKLYKNVNSLPKDKLSLTLDEIKSRKAEILLKMRELSALSSRRKTLKEVLEEYHKSQQ